MQGTSFSGISEQVLNQAAIEELVADPACGAVVSFVGRVRNHDPEATGEVLTLEYSAHPDAERTLANIITEFSETNPHLRIAAFHRIGTLGVGDSALVVCVTASHRTDTFVACRDIVEQIKLRVPIWKKQHTASGEAVWVGMS